ncbi:MAG: TlpA family protein disulfide reductase [Chloroflexota bacterium]|jgi:cytochrome c biogenesis protein CcmG/thiol:disulfide interchange protein DsbE|nr:TlpA family protein disulfide reductase [Chloroflexota bacterium]MDH5244336.1 TlpA family protein disulfide reductase [Chloroflexota bacterium]
MDALSMPAAPPRSGRLRSERFRTIAVLVVVGIALVGAAVLMEQPWADDGYTDVTLTGDVSAVAPAAGMAAPDFKTTTIDGTPVSISEYQGQPVWLTFGASWCADCRGEAPDLQATYEKYAPQGLVVLSVSIDEDEQAVRDYAQRVGLTFTQVADPSTIIASRYRILGVPTHYFISPEGTIEEVRLGGLPPEEMERMVGTILQ